MPTTSGSGRNPAWTYDELILALDLYVNVPGARAAKTHPAIAELSTTLRELPLHPVRPDAPRFRNRNSVYLKLQNFKSVDPSYAGVGLQAGAGARERQVWQAFADRPDELRETAQAIRSAAHLGVVFAEAPQDEGVSEGAILLALHQTRERARSDEKKRRVLEETGRLQCEVCAFDFADAYGDLGRGFAECHHKLPLAAGTRTTRLADLAIVCANCHRMLHRHSPVLTVERLRALLADTKPERQPSQLDGP
jgi:5-methylcytosine-specific restriction enzyme A